MKSNEAPEKLYLSKPIYSTYLYQVPDPDDESNIEYIRTDAFIEKVCEFFAPYIPDNSGGYERAAVIEDFINFMKGE